MKDMLRAGENIYHSQMHNVPKFIKLINIKKSQEMRKRDCTLMHDSWPPPTMRGGNFQNLRPKNAKNHEISLLQMQGCPQSNIKQEIKSFCFENVTKSNNELS
jgi:hypothetical protein